MTTNKINNLVQELVDRGFESSTIKGMYLEHIKTDDEIDEIMKYLNANKGVPRKDINFMIHKICLKRRGIDL